MVATAFGGWVMLTQRPEFSFAGPRGGEVFLATAEVAQTMHFEIARANGTGSLFVRDAEVSQANARVLRIVGGTQRAVRARVDHKWGPRTHRRIRAVRAKARSLALDRAVTTRFVQNVVGAPAPGTWDGPSRPALVDTVTKLQRAWRVHDDGSWGEVTEAAFTLQSRKFLHYKPIVVP